MKKIRTTRFMMSFKDEIKRFHKFMNTYTATVKEYVEDEEFEAVQVRNQEMHLKIHSRKHI